MMPTNIDLKLLESVSPEMGELIAMKGKYPVCTVCAEGDKPSELDCDGVLSSISGKPGLWCHSYEDAYWPCVDKCLDTIAAKLCGLARDVKGAFERGVIEGETKQAKLEVQARARFMKDLREGKIKP